DDFQLVVAGDYVSDAQDAESAEVEEETTQSETEGEGGKKPVKKSSGKKKGVPTRKLCGMAVLTARAVVLSCTVHIPYFGAAFLEYSPSDVPVLIASFMYGPVWGLVITALVSLIQGLTVSAGSGWIGIAMNFLSTGIFVLSAGLIYKFKHDIKGATIGLVVGFVCGVVSMILWNILITPLYMNVPRETVLAMIPTVFLPFNVLKYAGNAAMTFSLYKATGKFFKLAFGKVPDKTIDDVDASIDGKHISKSVDDTYDLAKRLADTLEGGEIILLNGDLGAGKTTFSKGLAKALGIEGDVTSPTFTIMNVYEDGRLKLNHLDMYRIEHEDELYELGVEDAMTDDAVTVIEWNKLTFTGKKVISIDIKAEKNKRIFTIKNENTCS
ncbi:MAG: tRNA (adenosine(37)-N6)-threonylcarbamoyltransferase complex ATPase subunit type 1 TsaE, partial [Clostridia bacterium]|nr:tRNA (adenosine(37)-N6)-threonylcarbamoyltransferase complex ATPase subunit type 1 TsaE [Clostridia bacterium]